jgi:hypothetical protein
MNFKPRGASLLCWLVAGSAPLSKAACIASKGGESRRNASCGSMKLCPLVVSLPRIEKRPVPHGRCKQTLVFFSVSTDICLCTRSEETVQLISSVDLYV